MMKNRKRVAEYFWNHGRSHSFAAFKSLRNRAGYLLSENGLLRGENVWDLQLPDFFSVEMEEEGPTDCTAMVILKGRGKTNQYSKPCFSGYYCHSDVTLCSVSCIAFYLFLRYHILEEPFPDFSTSPGWYDISMFCSYVTKNQQPFSASAHAAAIRVAHEKLQILSTKLTHGGRVFGRQQLEQAGVDKVSTDVAGGWSVGAGEGCYGNGLSRPAMRAMAGFPHNDKVFYLPRASLEPPQSLQQQIFPELDNWIVRHNEGDGCEWNFALNVTLDC
jgi:hypothetical protein